MELETAGGVMTRLVEGQNFRQGLLNFCSQEGLAMQDARMKVFGNSGVLHPGWPILFQFCVDSQHVAVIRLHSLNTV